MKTRIKILSGSREGQEVLVNRQIITIGRDLSATLRLQGQLDRTVSKRHCHIEVRNTTPYLVDDGSRNGTLLNGRSITISELSNGDEIQLGVGGPRLQFSFSAGPYENLNPESLDFGGGLNSPGLLPRKQTPNLSEYFQSPRAASLPLILSLGICAALLIFAILLSDVGLNAFGIGLIAAFLPSVVYLLPFFLLLRFSPKPLWFLGAAFAWGATVAIVVSYLVNTGVQNVALSITGDQNIALVAGGLVSAPIIEELCKGAGLLFILIWFKKYLDDTLDAVVFAALIALGFSTVENVFYYGSGYRDGGAVGLVTLFILRGILTPFAHVTFTVLIGAMIGIARELRVQIFRYVLIPIGIVGSIILHSVWNSVTIFPEKYANALGFGVLCEGYPSCGFLMSYLVIWIPMFLLMGGGFVGLLIRQRSTIRKGLEIEIARRFLDEDIMEIATSFFSRVVWIYSAPTSARRVARRNISKAICKLGMANRNIEKAALRGDTTINSPIAAEMVARINFFRTLI